ncbi:MULTISPECIES: sensor histidine kinase [unclassified Tolypothrix]|uniref:sensor histidine kinase n=1 Tax=unclassified Tolypothrix TaxID=2649714 RepID=UPI00000BADEB|nr:MULTISPECIES: ATP-binding protein [unclassified Tolypothrix]BAY92873.1 multi-sensor signal transduction histidine kinase [Microchaete diplosiphon NIES-3275]AAL76159.1 phytochrome-like protein [Tolypothrix sp. PCC 7601]EKF02970.1 sensor histidine kinase [Tolypothrix sp. PCC 7601]MBE9083334.1 GAF domain-containing protein [Tolypothrix sp. LEGE 11397]UYD26784.1 GAF domain-containing protein [Tolypothrix sp. PCC 7712]
MVSEFQAQSINVNSLKEAAIHVCSQIQPHGVLLVLGEPELNILQISSNTWSVFGILPEDVLQKKLEDLLDPFQIERIKAGILEGNLDYINPTKIWVRKKGDEYVVFDAVFHRNPEGLLILELEPAISQENIPFLSFYHLARASINQLEKTTNLRDFCQIIVQEVRKVTGFDRVMLYKFDDDGHGSVIAEEKLDSMEPYLGLHYPESDIPKPARKLFASNFIRLIPDAHAEPVQILPINHPQSQQPIDLTNSILRTAANCHLEYLHNMGVGASLTISLIKDGKLWGLIACHHQTPKYVSYEFRKACEFLGRVIFTEISTREETEDYDYRMNLAYIQTVLVEYMSQEENFIDGLVKHQPNLLNLTSAQGAAVCFGDRCTVIGQTPKEEDLNFLLQWLKNNVREEVFYTDSLPRIYPDAEKFKNVASGLLAIPISKRNYVLWFRPEVIQTVNWGGNPNEAFEVSQTEGNLRLVPRKSFELWKENVQLTSLRWKAVEIKAALELRKAIINIVLRQADELAQLAHDLERSNAELKKFAYVASHDLQEPLNQVANYVQLLEMRYENELDEDAKEFINFAVEGVSLMQTLIDDVLAYSKVDMQASAFQLTEVETPLNRSLSNLRGRIHETGAMITHDPLPTVMADSTQLMQLFQNLIANAIKFRSEQPPKIHIGAERLEDEWLFSVQDNGIGLEPRFSDRIFVIFQRLHTREEYPGTGMGLAICKKIIECHRGRIWVESQLGEGATFYFTIPVGGRERERRNGRQTQKDLFGRG